MDLDDEADINFNISDENMIQKEGEIGEQGLLDVDNAQKNVENDSKNGHRFPYIEEGGWINCFINYKERNFLWKLMKILKIKTNLIGIKYKDYIKDLSQHQKD